MFRDRQYLSTLFKIALPITLQQAIMASVNMVDVMMIGQLGEVSIASVGLANQVFFVFMIMLFGISSGAAIFTAQYWGKGDIVNLRKVMGLGLVIGVAVGVFFALVSLLIPDTILRFYTRDEAVIQAGAAFLRITALYYPFTAVTYIFAAILRSTTQVRLPVAVTSAVLALKVLLNYLLIFGNWGFPELGIMGAAVSTTIIRLVECCVLVWLSYRLRTAAAARPKELLAFNRAFTSRFFVTTLPVILNETLWAFGITTYQSIYARIGTNSIAAMNISSSIEQMGFVFFMGLSHATAVIIGNLIGAGEEERARLYAKRSIIFSVILSFAMGAAIILLAPVILPVYKISAEAMRYASIVLTVMGFTLWIRGSNAVILVGILRSGGDTRFAFFAEFISMWAVGVPLAYFAATVLHFEVQWVFIMVLSDELIKLFIGLWRTRSGKWLHNLVAHTADV